MAGFAIYMFALLGKVQLTKIVGHNTGIVASNYDKAME